MPGPNPDNVASGSSCKETSGILFKKKCPAPATEKCTRCQKKICSRHFREVQGKKCCIACVRKFVRQSKNPKGEGLQWIEDDAYFYYESSLDFSDPYDAEDYDLFEADANTADDYDAGAFENDWSGS